MDLREILIVVCAIIATISVIRIRIMYMMKGEKLKATVKTYVENQAYFPIMEFMYNGEMINLKTRNGYKTKKYQLGEELEILYIPGNNEGVRIVNDYTDILYAGLFIICAIVIVVARIFY